MHRQIGDCPIRKNPDGNARWCDSSCAWYIKEEFFGYEGCTLAAIPFILGKTLIEQLIDYTQEYKEQ